MAHMEAEYHPPPLPLPAPDSGTTPSGAAEVSKLLSLVFLAEGGEGSDVRSNRAVAPAASLLLPLSPLLLVLLLLHVVVLVGAVILVVLEVVVVVIVFVVVSKTEPPLILLLLTAIEFLMSLQLLESLI